MHLSLLLVQLTAKLFKVVRLELCNHGSFLLTLLAHLLDEILRLLLDLLRIKALLVQTMGFLALNVLHLTLQVFLNFLILAELEHLALLCLHSVPAGVLVDHIAPEPVLLFLFIALIVHSY